MDREECFQEQADEHEALESMFLEDEFKILEPVGEEFDAKSTTRPRYVFPVGFSSTRICSVSYSPRARAPRLAVDMNICLAQKAKVTNRCVSRVYLYTCKTITQCRVTIGASSW